MCYFSGIISRVQLFHKPDNQNHTFLQRMCCQLRLAGWHTSRVFKHEVSQRARVDVGREGGKGSRGADRVSKRTSVHLFISHYALMTSLRVVFCVNVTVGRLSP